MQREVAGVSLALPKRVEPELGARTPPAGAATPNKASGLPAPPTIRLPSTGGGQQSSSTGGNNGNRGASSIGAGSGGTSIHGGPTEGTTTTQQQQNVTAFGAVDFRSEAEIKKAQGIITPAQIDTNESNKTHRVQQAIVENATDSSAGISLEIFRMDISSMEA
ncbi:hypothetical protein THAOC_12122 [Thalassiosira oceanica]|uniref:Uncharacterized protein n=1 Tax=Thalassiosira oceanica TaxID=159749 RepID=K0SKR7_THAOC|nr:hypothetical protein THAOC_12122 [Thalassiosira oceanica]|eukprot:EJK66903.1 hypothetical protein THAOC_12122 [Thalassiosira oceanica]